MATKKAKSAKANLRDANKEVKSLSGVIKIVATFWSKGYKEAFAEFGIKFADLNLQTIKPMLQTNDKGEIFVVRKVDKKDEQGEVIKDEQGKRKYKTVYGKTQKEANQKAQEIKERIGKGLSLDSSDTFGKWAEHWLMVKQAEVLL